MAMNISGFGIGNTNNTYGGINKNSKQYQAAVKEHLNGIIENEMSMSPEERLVYETFGGRERVLSNMARQYDSEGNYVNSRGVAGMDATNVPEAQRNQLIRISEDSRQDMFDETLRHFKQENGAGNGDTTRRTDVYTKYQLSVPVADRLKGSYTLSQYERAYAGAMKDACLAADPDWEIGKPIPSGALDGLTRESVEATITQRGNKLYRSKISS